MYLWSREHRSTISLYTLLSFVTVIRMPPQWNQKKWFLLVTERSNSFVFLVIFCLTLIKSNVSRKNNNEILWMVWDQHLTHRIGLSPSMHEFPAKHHFIFQTKLRKNFLPFSMRPSSHILMTSKHNICFHSHTRQVRSSCRFLLHKERVIKIHFYNWANETAESTLI